MLPEYHLTSWAPEHPSWAAACAAAVSDGYISRYAALAGELGVCIVPGTVVEPYRGAAEDDDGTAAVVYHNTTYLLTPGPDGRGEVAGRYVKKNLWHPERPVLASSGAVSSSPHVAFGAGPALGGARVGLLICWDLAFPEAMRALARDGADIVVVPAFWVAADADAEGAGTDAGVAINPASETVYLTAVPTARACENGVAVVFVNAAGPKGGTKSRSGNGAVDGYAGLSQVAAPLLGILGGEGPMGAEEGTKVVELDMEVLKVAEGIYKARQDLTGGEGRHY